jgi:hypothetical protein
MMMIYDISEEGEIVDISLLANRTAPLIPGLFLSYAVQLSPSINSDVMNSHFNADTGLPNDLFGLVDDNYFTQTYPFRLRHTTFISQ